MKKKFNWLGFIALIIWDIGAIQYLFYSMAFTNNILSMSSQTSAMKSAFNVYYIVLFIILILADLYICCNNIWMIVLGTINLAWYGIYTHFQVSPLSIVGCILVILAGVYGTKTSKNKNA